MVLERPTPLNTVYANLLAKPAKERSGCRMYSSAQLYPLLGHLVTLGSPKVTILLAGPVLVPAHCGRGDTVSLVSTN